MASFLAIQDPPSLTRIILFRSPGLAHMIGMVTFCRSNPADLMCALDRNNEPCSIQQETQKQQQKMMEKR